MLPSLLSRSKAFTSTLLLTALTPSLAFAGEADMVLPDLDSQKFLGMGGKSLLMWGLLLCLFGLGFGLWHFWKLRKLAVHVSMREVSELIYETCKTYLVTQGKFLIVLQFLIGAIIVVYFGWLQHFAWAKVALILFCSIIGILGSYGVAWFGMRINTYANSRTAFASLTGKAFPVYDIPLRAGMSIGMLLISIELLVMLVILLFVDPHSAGPCFIGFAIGESLGASVLRIAGGIFTKIADIGSDLMKIVFKIKEDDARNPGVIADCVGDNAGDSVGPTADGFETYGVTGVALISFILLAVQDAKLQVQLLVWLFAMRLIMLIASAVSYWINDAIARFRFADKVSFHFETPLLSLVFLTSGVSIAMTYGMSYLLLNDLTDPTMWWKLASIITCGTLAGAIIPELVNLFTSPRSAYVSNIVNSSSKGGASLNILAGFVAGNFSAFWMGFTILGLMAAAWGISTLGMGSQIVGVEIFAFGLVAFGFLGMGPVTIAVDSYGPVADNAQSIYELSQIEDRKGIRKEIKDEFGFEPDFVKAKQALEENDGAGNTFKATAKPVLIGTAVVGATTMIFSIIMLLTGNLQRDLYKLSPLYPPFLFGLLAGGSVIYWFTGASTHAVTSGAYKAVEFIKQKMSLDGTKAASMEDSKKVVEICTQYAQKGMINLFLAIFFFTLAFACINAFFFIGYLISIALFGLFQAIFMANAGGAWDNAKKVVEVDLKKKGSALHDATVVGDTVGDPFKDTSSVALNPVIKFTTLFGLLALELALEAAKKNEALVIGVGVAFALVAFFFVLRSFSSLRIHVSRAELDVAD